VTSGISLLAQPLLVSPPTTTVIPAGGEDTKPAAIVIPAGGEDSSTSLSAAHQASGNPIISYLRSQ